MNVKGIAKKALEALKGKAPREDASLQTTVSYEAAMEIADQADAIIEKLRLSLHESTEINKMLLDKIELQDKQNEECKKQIRELQGRKTQ